MLSQKKFNEIFEFPSDMEISTSRKRVEIEADLFIPNKPEIESMDEDYFYDQSSFFLTNIDTYLHTIIKYKKIEELNWLISYSYKNSYVRNIINEWVGFSKIDTSNNGLIVCFLALCVEKKWKKAILTLFQHNCFPSLYEGGVLCYFIYDNYETNYWVLDLIVSKNLAPTFPKMFKSLLFFYAILCGEFKQLEYLMKFREEWWPSWNQVLYLLNHPYKCNEWDSSDFICNSENEDFWDDRRSNCENQVLSMLKHNKDCNTILKQNFSYDLVNNIIEPYLFHKHDYTNFNEDIYKSKIKEKWQREYSWERFYKFFGIKQDDEVEMTDEEN